MIFVFDTKCYGSSTGFIQDYNEIMKHVPNPVANQTKGLLARHFLTKNIVILTKIYQANQTINAPSNLETLLTKSKKKQI